jgi:hypothetical protein
MTQYFYSVIDLGDMAHSDDLAKRIAEQDAEWVTEAGGKLFVKLGGGEEYAELLVELPDGVNPDEALPPGMDFHVAHVTTLPTVEDHGIR